MGCSNDVYIVHRYMIDFAPLVTQLRISVPPTGTRAVAPHTREPTGLNDTKDRFLDFIPLEIPVVTIPPNRDLEKQLFVVTLRLDLIPHHKRTLRDNYYIIFHAQRHIGVGYCSTTACATL